MEKAKITQLLSQTYTSYSDYVEGLNADEWDYAPEGKWSAAQQTIHLIKSTSPLVKALGLPKFILKSRFGKANRSTRTYEALVSRYKEKLTNNPLVGENPFGPGSSTRANKEKLIAQLGKNVEALVLKLERWDEPHLDEYILPHPLLGKLTIREMMYFTAYHAEHHRNIIKIYLKGV